MTSRHAAAALALAAALMAWGPTAAAQAQIAPPRPEPPVAIPEPPQALAPPGSLAVDEGREEEIDALLAALARAEAGEWKPIQGRIMAHWSRAESPAMTLLLARATRSMEEEKYEKALEFLDDLVRLAPEFAEGWNRRATVHFLRKDYGRALADIQRTLALEPRHFGALSGLGIILDRLDRDEDALRVFRRALEIHPNLEGAQEAVERLVPEVEGRPL